MKLASMTCAAMALALLSTGCASVRTIEGPKGRDHAVEGYAVWYGARYHGRRTASGERFNMHAMTAAHRTLPFGTLVRVTDLKTGRHITVRVNDRGPFGDDERIIDLAKGAASKLDMVRKGVIRVRLDVVRWP